MEETSKRKKIIGVTTVIVVIALALVVGVSAYNAPGNKLTRQLDLGHKYLGNGQYEEAVLAFEKAIEIDEKCMEAYVGGIEAYLQTGNQEAMLKFYDKALAVIENAEEVFLNQNMDAVVDIYLAADQIYADAPQQAVEILEKGWRATENTEIKDKLVDNYIMLTEMQETIRDYKEELEIYDRLLELAGDEERVLSSLEKCLREYIEFLKGEEKYDDIRALAEKYGDVVLGIDFDEILRQIEEEKAMEEKRALEEVVVLEESAGEEEADSEESENVEAGLFGDRSWVDDLHQKIAEEDADVVFAIMEQPDFLEKCEVYPNNNGALADQYIEYSLLTSDGHVFWAIKWKGIDRISIACTPDDKAVDYEIGSCVEDCREYVFEIINGERSWVKGIYNWGLFHA
ncbi:MAG: hypothetical protein NC548_24575 [Lachnospiraceae bacterium]|nr:hypothetical protein [Lachnospiraceae bacterium]